MGNIIEQYYRDNDIEELDGYNRKRFVRVRGDQLSRMWEELYSNPDNSYVTYLDEIIDDEDLASYAMEYVSCLAKEYAVGFTIRDNYMDISGIYSEVVASRLANLFGIPVAYNTTLSEGGDDVFEEESRPSFEVLLSVDFVPKDCEFLSFLDVLGREIEEVTSEAYCIEEWLKEFERVVDRLDCVTDDMRNLLREQFIMQYLFKGLIIEDYDMNLINFGFIRNTKTQDISMSPLYDMEDGLRCAFGGSAYKNLVLNDLLYLGRKYPHLLAKFMAKVEMLKSDFEFGNRGDETNINIVTDENADKYPVIGVIRNECCIPLLYMSKLAMFAQRNIDTLYDIYTNLHLYHPEIEKIITSDNSDDVM